MPGAGDGGGSGSPAPTPTTQSALAQSPMASGGGVPRTVTTPVSSSSRAMDKLLAAEPMLKPTRPGFNASSLAVAAGHLPRLAPVELAETETLKRKGFAQAKPGLWVHSDKSWVRFHDGNVYRGHEDCVFTSIVNGPGPSAARVAQ